MQLYLWEIVSTLLLFTSFSKTLLTAKRRPTGQVDLASKAVDLSTTFLNTWIINELQTIWRDSSNIEYIHESSGWQFLRTTTGLQSGPETFDELRFIITFWNILRVTEILCSFKLVPEGKAGKGICKSSRLELLEKFLGNNFWFIRGGRQQGCIV